MRHCQRRCTGRCALQAGSAHGEPTRHFCRRQTVVVPDATGSSIAETLSLPYSRKEIPFESWSALPDLALLAIKWHREGGRAFWHWVVFVREQDGIYVLDSKRALKAHVRTDFGRMRPKWSIRVEGIRSRP